MSADETPDPGNPDSSPDSLHGSREQDRVEEQTCPIEPNVPFEEHSESESRRRFLRAAVITSAAAAGAGGVIAGILGLSRTSAPIKFVGGALSCSCPSGEVCCSGVCVNVQTDPNNCGGCGFVCQPAANATVICAAGSCHFVCNAGFADCDGNPTNGCETNLEIDANNCGLCGFKCPTGEVCRNGACFNHCTDGIKDYDETDVDCGGPTCLPCPNGKHCLQNSDCVSGVCSSNICAAPTCFDGVKNGLETDVDCGGPQCPPCGIGKHCLQNSDCITMHCVSGVCQP